MKKLLLIMNSSVFTSLSFCFQSLGFEDDIMRKPYLIILSTLIILFSMFAIAGDDDTTFKCFITNSKIPDSVVVKSIFNDDDYEEIHYVKIFQYTENGYKKIFTDKLISWNLIHFGFWIEVCKNPFHDSLETILYRVRGGGEKRMDYYLVGKREKDIKILLQNENIPNGWVMCIDTFLVEYFELVSSIIYPKGSTFWKKKTNTTYHPHKKPEDLELKFFIDEEGVARAPKNMKAKVNQRMYFTQTDPYPWGDLRIFISRMNPDKDDYKTQSLLGYTFKKPGKYKIEFFAGKTTITYVIVK